MKNKNYLFQIIKVSGWLPAVIFTILTLPLMAQGVAINFSGASADPSAMLDVSGTNSGILIPRMTQAQKLSISSPATGLMIYQTDGVAGFWYYDGVVWTQSIGAAGAAGTTGNDGATGATGAAGPTGATGLLSPGNVAGNTPYWDGTQWVVNSSNIYNNGGSVGIGTNYPDASAVIDISSTNAGALIPRMTETERNAIASPAEGLLIFNITSRCLEVYISPKWQSYYCGCNAPASPLASVNIFSQDMITWQWNAVMGAEGYKYNTSNNYLTATDNGTGTSVIHTGLSCNTNYSLYVWAYNSCDTSNYSHLTQTTGTCCGPGLNVTFTYKGSQVTYGTVVGQNNTCWLDRNLGAAAVATSYNHAAALGDLFQWGRSDDGHQTYNSATTSTQSSNYVPSHSNFIYTNETWYIGSNPAPNALWQGVSGLNNPCPNGWRLPSETELGNELQSWTSANYNGAIASPLKWPAPGLRLYSNAGYYLVGSYGCYWTSTVDGTNKAKRLYFTGTAAIMTTNERAYGMAVRCILE